MIHLIMKHYLLLGASIIHSIALTMRISSNPSFVLVFLGYSSTQRAYQYFNPQTNKVLIFGQVTFHESQFQFSSFDPTAKCVSHNTIESWSHLSLSLSSSPSFMYQFIMHQICQQLKCKTPLQIS